MKWNRKEWFSMKCKKEYFKERKKFKKKDINNIKDRESEINKEKKNEIIWKSINDKLNWRILK